jgi:Tol biopolymer transport system component
VGGVSRGEATVPGENGQIAFVSNRDGNDEIYVMNADGSNQVRLTSHPASDLEPDWSPDGRSIAFTSGRTGQFAIHVMNADGSGMRLLGEGIQPSWSPDGSRLAFLSGGSVWVMNADGSGQRRITNPASDTNRRGPVGERMVAVGDIRPQWSPDGASIMFERGYDSPFVQIAFTVSPSGGPVHLISEFIGVVSVDDWSPDATMLAGSSMSPGLCCIILGPSVFVIDVAGAPGFSLPRPVDLPTQFEPVWSPDGTALALTASRSTSDQRDIHVAPASASGPLVNLTNNPASDTQPDWQSLNPYPVGFVDSTTGTWHLRSESAAITSFYYGNPGDLPMMGDWNGDGIDTPGLFRQSDGFVYLRNSNTQGVADVRFFFGDPGDIPLAGDFDGDGRDTVSIYRPSEGRIYVINHLGSGDAGLGAADFSYLFGNPSDKPFVGDFNGDGVDTVGLHRESTGLMYFRNTHVQGPAEWSFLYGDPGDRVVSFDWNHDGNDSPAVFRPGNSKFFIRFTNTVGPADREFFIGQNSWLPVSGEFGLS